MEALIGATKARELAEMGLRRLQERPRPAPNLHPVEAPSGPYVAAFTDEMDQRILENIALCATVASADISGMAQLSLTTEECRVLYRRSGEFKTGE